MHIRYYIGMYLLFCALHLAGKALYEENFLFGVFYSWSRDVFDDVT